MAGVTADVGFLRLSAADGRAIVLGAVVGVALAVLAWCWPRLTSVAPAFVSRTWWIWVALAAALVLWRQTGTAAPLLITLVLALAGMATMWLPSIWCVVGGGIAAGLVPWPGPPRGAALVVGTAAALGAAGLALWCSRRAPPALLAGSATAVALALLTGLPDVEAPLTVVALLAPLAVSLLATRSSVADLAGDGAPALAGPLVGLLLVGGSRATPVVAGGLLVLLTLVAWPVAQAVRRRLDPSYRPAPGALVTSALVLVSAVVIARVGMVRSTVERTLLVGAVVLAAATASLWLLGERSRRSDSTAPPA